MAAVCAFSPEIRPNSRALRTVDIGPTRDSEFPSICDNLLRILRLIVGRIVLLVDHAPRSHTPNA